MNTSLAGYDRLTSDLQIGVELDSELWRDMKILALKKDGTAGELLEEAIRDYLEKR